MRSSPNFLVVSRSEEDHLGLGAPGGAEESAPPKRAIVPRWPRRDDVEFNELNVSLRISYKTLVLVFVLFDVFHKVVDATVNSDVIPFLR
ncbi:TPA_asm: hypothetical protein [ssRNA phage Zoerhiza.1_4]|uniref:Uncharacterized protein n=2 Tax=Leviviricetes TaxID=2842243 RepID=A0A8S5L2W0_9VIRU|nr:hypothetical protein QIQ34_gp3 [ssRNA phage Zoerhiza.1_4]QDH89349.1 MAG: hypothetical protein H1Rhizo25476_000002 [Leviviridae sp.]DAD51976.1 TPA_asm: hypothetical protein [ssRNA phage Zoerhiza.1_4]